MERFCWTRPYAGETSHTLAGKNNNWSFLVFPVLWRMFHRQKSLERAVGNAQVTTSTIILNNRNHGLAHEDTKRLWFLNPSLHPCGELEMPCPTAHLTGVLECLMMHDSNAFKVC